MARRRVIVVGGANTDICGCPAQSLVRHDSNPGRVTIRHGGVGRNIACDLARLGLDVSFVTAVGEDLLSAGVLEGCLKHSVDVSLSRTVPGARGSVYLYLTDGNGEMDAAIADMDVVSALTPDYLRPLLSELNVADAVVLDGNLEKETIVFLCKNVTAPLYADPVSGAKAARFAQVIGRLAAIKPNLIEARALTGKDSAEDCAAALLDAGVGRVFLSLGGGGILAASGEERVLLPCERMPVVNTTGAGDAATAAIVWACVSGLDLADAALAAVRAGAVTAACDETVSPELKAEALL